MQTLKPETRKPETRNPKTETRTPKPETRNPKPQTLNSELGTSNPKPATLIPQPETPTPKCLYQVGSRKVEQKQRQAQGRAVQQALETEVCAVVLGDIRLWVGDNSTCAWLVYLYQPHTCTQSLSTKARTGSDNARDHPGAEEPPARAQVRSRHCKAF